MKTHNITYPITPKGLCKAIYNRDILACIRLIDLGVDVNGYKDFIPLIAATEFNLLPVVSYLINKGAKVDAVNQYGETALMLAAYNGCLPSVKILLREGANIDLQKNNGKTALMLASLIGQFDAVKLLITLNSNFNLKNRMDNTALDIALYCENHQIAKYLLDLGANYNPRCIGYKIGHLIALEVYRAKCSAFLLGTQQRVGARSPIKRHITNGPLGERQVLGLILKFINPDTHEMKNKKQRDR